MSDIAELTAVDPSKRRSLDWPSDARRSLGGSLVDSTPLEEGPRANLPPTPASAAPARRRGGGMRVSLEGLGEGVDVPVPPTPSGEAGDEADGQVFSADVLVDATGARCGLFTTIGFEQVTALKSARALGVVCHFYNGKSSWENALDEANWAQQFQKERFARLKETQGVDLQNIVYYRSTGAFAATASHYFVMTADAESLCQSGALRSIDVAEATLCAASNVDRDKLVAYARRAVAEFVPELAETPLIDDLPGVSGVQIFDFSERKVSNRASVLVDADSLGGSEGQQVLVTRVGDALQEPFWPEGLGINRGFLHCFDCADLLQGYAALLHTHGRQVQPPGIDAEAKAAKRAAATNALLQRREELFTLVKRVSGTNRLTELKPTRQGNKPVSYAIDPATRYVHLSRSQITPNYL